MSKLISKILSVSLGLLLAMVICTNIASAHSVQSPASQSCGHFTVYLHGTSPATTKCRDTVQNSQHIIPYTSITDCGPGTLFVYADINEGGDDVCFVGTGFINMTDVPSPWWWLARNWNDQASSYVTNCTDGTFYSDINGNGSHYNFVRQESGNFDGSTTPFQQTQLNNDTLSSIRITTSSCTAP